VNFTKLDFLDDPHLYKSALGQVSAQPINDRSALRARLETSMTSSAWATKQLFKPGIRNLFLQERLGVRAVVKQFQHFLGDQEYLFKFFFLNAFSNGNVPCVVDLLQQGINIPAFRFRLEAIDMLVELGGAGALPAIFNLVSGLDGHATGTKDVLARVDANLYVLAENSMSSPKLTDAFTRLRLLLVQQGTR
jgi:hypothetical protein